jgi:hypothetical protein
MHMRAFAHRRVYTALALACMRSASSFLLGHVRVLCGVSMYVCTCACIHRYDVHMPMYVCVHVYAHMRLQECMYVCVYMYAYAHKLLLVHGVSRVP